MNFVVRLTSRAKDHLIRMLQTHKSRDALFYVEGGGCNGLKYKLEPVERAAISKADEIVPLGGDMNLRVCNKSLMHVLGTEIDWRSDFMGKAFHFKNPNTAGTCGCGATFTPK